MTIREATLADVPELVALGLRFRATTGYASIIEENPGQMQRTAETLITQENGVIFVSEARTGEVVGMIGVLCFPHHLSGVLTVGEVMWYLLPASRGDGLRLMKQAEVWARNRGAHTIQMIQPTGTDVDVLYRHCGYQAIETIWHKRLIPLAEVA